MGKPLQVVFTNEDGVDGGALRNDLLGLVTKHFQDFLENANVSGEIDDSIFMAAGMWLALAFLQGDLAPNYVLTAIGRYHQDLPHPFSVGLNRLHVTAVI